MSKWAILLCTTMLWASASVAAIKVEDPKIRMLPPSVPNTAAYFTVYNSGDEAVEIIEAHSEVAKTVELHNHIMRDDMMSMQKQNSVVVPAGQSIKFQPGGLHVMLFGLEHAINAEEPVAITLKFSNGEQIVMQATPVKPHHEHHH